MAAGKLLHDVESGLLRIRDCRQVNDTPGRVLLFLGFLSTEFARKDSPFSGAPPMRHLDRRELGPPSFTGFHAGQILGQNCRQTWDSFSRVTRLERDADVIKNSKLDSDSQPKTIAANVRRATHFRSPLTPGIRVGRGIGTAWAESSQQRT